MITSRSNPLVKQIRRLNQKKHRQKEGLGFVEGLRSTLTAIEQRPELIDRVILAPDLLKNEHAAERVSDLLPDHVPDLLSAELFQSISSRDNPIGIGALVRTPAVRLSQFQFDQNQNAPLILLDRISDPGNLGTILRTADGAGVAGVLLSGSSADILHPTAIKASMGTVFSVQVAQATEAEMIPWLTNLEVPLVGTSAKGTSIYRTTRFESTFVMMMGNEGEGLAPDLQALTDINLMIPMRGQASSLNVSVATGILIYHLYNGR